MPKQSLESIHAEERECGASDDISRVRMGEKVGNLRRKPRVDEAEGEKIGNHSLWGHHGATRNMVVPRDLFQKLNEPWPKEGRHRRTEHLTFATWHPSPMPPGPELKSRRKEGGHSFLGRGGLQEEIPTESRGDEKTPEKKGSLCGQGLAAFCSADLLTHCKELHKKVSRIISLQVR